MTTPREKLSVTAALVKEVNRENERDARYRAALGAKAETPDPMAWCEGCGYAHRPDDGDCVDAPSGHWVDLASPETAEALARAYNNRLVATGRAGGVSMDDWRAILAAMRETGR